MSPLRRTDNTHKVHGYFKVRKCTTLVYDICAQNVGEMYRLGIFSGAIEVKLEIYIFDTVLTTRCLYGTETK